MKEIKLSKMEFPAPYEEEVEIVERKGIGHPDTIIDLLSENLSVELSKLYLDEFGAIMHHNVDKGLLVGGEAIPRFKGGEVIAPIEIFLVGRAIKEKDNEPLPIDELAIRSSREWLRKNIPNLKDEHVVIHTRIRPGSKDLVELFERFSKKGEVALANDTSFGVGFAPFDDLENVVYHTEQFLNSKTVKKEYPMIGEDIKVMGVRVKDKIKLTVAVAFVDKYVRDVREYSSIKERIKEMVKGNALSYTNLDVDVFVNTADDIEKGSVYITVTGTSSEQGDDGEVGRGNRVNGLITPYRPMSLEAAAGKNPVSHVGKIYNVSSRMISERIVAEVEGVKEAYTYLVSQIGKPINQPQVCDVRVRSTKPLASIQGKINKIVDEELEVLGESWKRFLNKEYDVA